MPQYSSVLRIEMRQIGVAPYLQNFLDRKNQTYLKIRADLEKASGRGRFDRIFYPGSGLDASARSIFPNCKELVMAEEQPLELPLNNDILAFNCHLLRNTAPPIDYDIYFLAAQQSCYYHSSFLSLFLINLRLPLLLAELKTAVGNGHLIYEVGIVDNHLIDIHFGRGKNSRLKLHHGLTFSPHNWVDDLYDGLLVKAFDSLLVKNFRTNMPMYGTIDYDKFLSFLLSHFRRDAVYGLDTEFLSAKGQNFSLPSEHFEKISEVSNLGHNKIAFYMRK